MEITVTITAKDIQEHYLDLNKKDADYYLEQNADQIREAMIDAAHWHIAHLPC